MSLFMVWSMFILSGTRALTGRPGVPIVRRAISTTQNLSVLSSAGIDRFRPFTFYASTAYCQPSQILSWQCGANCEANPNFYPVAAGGGSGTQVWYVGFDMSLQTVVVAHQGTEPQNVLALITDSDVELTNLDYRIFPLFSSSPIRVHSGFSRAQAKTAEKVLAAVQTALQQSKLGKVTIVGHSLGAAISLLDGVYLSSSLPGVSIGMIGYGMPRVGNEAFATYVDAHRDIDVAHVNNKKDPVPIVPGRFLGYHHPSGEKHIQVDGSWVVCPGQDNPNEGCTVGAVPNVFLGNLLDHHGPYGDVSMGC